MSKETRVNSELMLAAAQAGTPLWRNNSGASLDQSGRMIRFGLGNTSKRLNDVWKSSDLIGITPVTVTSAHVGMMLGVFTACEVKEAGWRGTWGPKSREQAQANFMKTVTEHGGIAGFVRSVEEYDRLKQILA